MIDCPRFSSHIVTVSGDEIKDTYSPGEKSALEITVKPWEEKKGLVLLVTRYEKPKIKKKLN
jgi:hypothetical protein